MQSRHVPVHHWNCMCGVELYLHFFKFGPRKRRMNSLTPGHFNSTKRICQDPLDSKAGWNQGKIRICWRREKPLPHAGILNPDLSFCGLDTVLTELSICCNYWTILNYRMILTICMPIPVRRGSTAACLLGLRVRNPPRAWLFVCCECCVFVR